MQIRFLWNHAPSRSPSPRAGAKWHKVLIEDGDILEELSDDLVFTEKVDGEASVFCRELSGSRSADFKNPKFNRKHFGKDKSKNDFYQVCGDGGEVVCCPLCPASVHLNEKCSGVRRAKDFMKCSHHKYWNCEKKFSAAGGILFPCQYCRFFLLFDNCLHTGEEVRLIGGCERFEVLGYDSTNKFVTSTAAKSAKKLPKRSLVGRSLMRAKRFSAPKLLRVFLVILGRPLQND